MLSRLILALGLSALFAGSLLAERYAVLVGVRKPESGDMKELEGPPFDVEALKERLVSSWNFAPGNVTTLVDKQATRQAILSAIQKTIEKATSGDYVLIYFSGHGTGSLDPGSPIAAGLGPNRGALIPYDADLSSSNSLNTLIVGQRDLRPLLEGLDSEAHAFVIMDACFAEDSTMGDGSPVNSRYAGLREEEARRPRGNLGRIVRDLSLRKDLDDAYSYANVLTFSASARYEPAADITASTIRSKRFQTVDGRPHGAFTNALLAALDGNADLNHDGLITNGELYQFVRETVETEFPQKPQMLLPVGKRGQLNAPLFGAQPNVAFHKAPSIRSGSALLALEGIPSSIRERIMNVPGVRIAEARRDLTLRAEPSGDLTLYRAGNWVKTYRADQLDPLLEDLAALGPAQELINYQFASQDFKVTMDIDPAGQGSFYDGQTLKLTASVDRDAYLLLVNVDGSGLVDVLFPIAPLTVAKAQQSIPLGTFKVSAPFGVQDMLLFAFPDLPAGLEPFSCSRPAPGKTDCPEFSANSERFQRLMRFLNGVESGSVAKSQVSTRP